MKYYFGQVPSEDVQMFGEDDLFEYNGDYYYNQLEVGTTPGGMEDFTITDTVGRSVPLSTDHLDTLIQVLQDIQENIEAIKNGKRIEEMIFDATEIRTVEW
jgi:hypothetical protein